MSAAARFNRILSSSSSSASSASASAPTAPTAAITATTPAPTARAAKARPAPTATTTTASRRVHPAKPTLNPSNKPYLFPSSSSSSSSSSPFCCFPSRPATATQPPQPPPPSKPLSSMMTTAATSSPPPHHTPPPLPAKATETTPTQQQLPPPPTRVLDAVVSPLSTTAPTPLRRSLSLSTSTPAAPRRPSVLPPIPSSSIHHHAVGNENADVEGMHSSSPRYPPLTKVANFRDVGRNYYRDVKEVPAQDGKVCRLKVGNLFRSARLDDATAEDVDTLKSYHGIRTVIDLRSDLERKECSHVASTFLFPAIEQEMYSELSPVRTTVCPEQTTAQGGDGAEAGYFTTQHNNTSETASIGSVTPGGGTRRRYSIEFAGHMFRRQGVWKPLSVWQKCKVVALIGSGQKPRAVQMIGHEVISPQGLSGLYRNFADYCGAEIVQALKIMTVAENFPVLVHCTQGKDRTGMVVAMALHCAGVDVGSILKDFERSQAGLDSQREVMVREMAKTGLDPSFSDAPAPILAETIAYIVDRFGSVDEYLERHGFTKDMREKLRDNFTEGITISPSTPRR
ncbi:hypothetical protein HDU87_003711 [Geranomyces variabilis]|uniref:Tyrosine specific protein phosphatases domain-containing protein n=1 Tax=Geranomyces variabilis TaxID=109894 RepID=A0AAD5TK99_9FUNG|nr:hypothetical protein HDU87_003711 [Geranomyces variabilis]